MSPPADAPAPGAEVEAATWPPVEVVEVDGWRVGRSGGFTRRANSAVPSGTACGVRPDDPAAVRAVTSTLDRVEGLYAERGARCVVRLDPLTAPGLDALLERRGYRAAAPTVVMTTALAAARRRVAGSRALDGLTLVRHDQPDDAWLRTWLGVKATSTTDTTLARRILRGARAQYLTAHDGAGAVGVLRAALAGPWLGLSCLAVTPHARGRGVGRALTRAALEGAPPAVQHAFLQVERSNEAATALYQGLGFVPADAYHYRER